MFSRIRNTWSQMKASALLMNVFEEVQDMPQEFDSRGINVSDFAVDVVKQCWNVTPELYDGRGGERPSHASIAIMALTFALWRAYGNAKMSGSMYPLLVKATAVLMMHIKVAIASGEFAVNRIDGLLLAQAIKATEVVDAKVPTHVSVIREKLLSLAEDNAK